MARTRRAYTMGRNEDKSGQCQQHQKHKSGGQCNSQKLRSWIRLPRSPVQSHSRSRIAPNKCSQRSRGAEVLRRTPWSSRFSGYRRCLCTSKAPFLRNSVKCSKKSSMVQEGKAAQ
ncbi:uncharacterized protein LOC115320722 [Ixodes scapularis]|uniref:uncharacterized protein LOC115320722 n=1 Tax=Ixodes scapularis TaxID=6945 RepID=UPI001A9E6CBB|nr:uncharacterized protein LOC115320722 [Ixodes scapularis]